MKYNDYLTPGEILQIYRESAVEKLAEHNLSVTEFDGMLKRAADPASTGNALLDMLKSFLQTSLFVGVPVGLMAHAVHKTSTNAGRKTRELQASLDHYRDAKQELRNNHIASQIAKGEALRKKERKAQAPVVEAAEKTVEEPAPAPAAPSSSNPQFLDW